MKIEISKRLKRIVSVGLVTASLSFTSQAFAQGPAIAQPIANWSYTGHSSTLTEGALRGQATVVSAVGQTVYLDSLAAVNYAEAYKRAIENSVALTKSYYERREIRNEYMQKYGPRAFVGEARKKFIEYYQPKRLSAQEFNSQHGKLTWPHILRQQQFAPVKNKIDEIFATRDSTNSGDGSTTHREVYKLSNALTGLLGENIGNMTSDQYINGLEFIRSVELEARTAMSADLKAVPVATEKAVPVATEDQKTNEESAPEIKNEQESTPAVKS